MSFKENGHEPGEGNMAGKTGNRKRIIQKSLDEMVLLSLIRGYHATAGHSNALIRLDMFRKTSRAVSCIFREKIPMSFRISCGYIRMGLGTGYEKASFFRS